MARLANLTVAYNAGINDFLAGWDQEQSWGLCNATITTKFSCFSKTDSQVLQSYEIKEALDIAREFCNKEMRPG